MEAYQERMIAELNELQERVDKLHKFVGDREKIVNLESEKLDLLMRQLHHMTMYEDVLKKRCILEGLFN